MSHSKNLILVIIMLLSFLPIFSDEKVTDEFIREQIKKLGDDNYKNREKAIKELSKLPYSYRKILTAELKNTQNIEVKDRLKSILDLSNDGLIELFSEYYLKGQKLFKESQYENAITEINKILEIDPDYLMALSLKAKILENKGDYKECLVLLKKLLEISSKNPKEVAEINKDILQVHLAAGNFPEAIVLLEALLQPTQNSPEVKNLLCNVYESNKQFQKAEDILLKDVSENPDNENYSSSLAWFYIRTGKIDKAKKIIEKLIALPKTANLNYALNCIFLEDFQKGLDSLKQNTESIAKDLKDKKDLGINEINNNDIFYLIYQYYFEMSTNQTTVINFKAHYNSFKDEAKKIWPLPLLGVYGGEVSIEKLETLMKNENPMEMRMKRCEGYFYFGVLKLCEKNFVEAKKYFQLSKDQKIPDYVETTADYYFLQKYK